MPPLPAGKLAPPEPQQPGQVRGTPPEPEPLARVEIERTYLRTPRWLPHLRVIQRVAANRPLIDLDALRPPALAATGDGERGERGAPITLRLIHIHDALLGQRERDAPFRQRRDNRPILRLADG